MNRLLKLLVCIGLCESAGILGSVFTISSVTTWYPTLVKPFFNPPSWIFGPVWTMLYLLMGISLFLVWEKKKRNLTWFWVQLVLNSLWSVVFFGLQSPLFGLVIIVLLWMSIFLTIQTFVKVQKTAAYLLLPYIVWVSFAAILNFSIVLLNP